MIRESTENYLETIYILSQRMEDVRSIDVCNELGYSKPTISVVMKQFRESGYIEMDASGHITLTPAGLEIALGTYDRHLTLTRLLTAMGVSKETAEEDACKIEHHISPEAFACIKEFLNRHLADQSN